MYTSGRHLFSGTLTISAFPGLSFRKRCFQPQGDKDKNNREPKLPSAPNLFWNDIRDASK